MRRDLVISRYKEDCDWIEEAKGLFDRTIMYNKGINDIIFRNVKIKNVPNVGREAQTWVQYILDYWDNMADTVFFIQGAPHSHTEKLLERISIDYNYPTPLTVKYMDQWPGVEVTKYDLCSLVNGFNVRAGDIRFFGHRPLSVTISWWNKVWSELFDCKPPKSYYYGYAAMWAVPKNCITRRGKKFWTRLNSKLQHNEDAYRENMDAWAMEALWNAVWDDPEKYPGRK